MSDKLTLTDLKEHCIKTLRMKDAMRIHGVKFKSDNVEQEHRMVLDLILEHEQMEEHDKKVRADAIEELLKKLCIGCAYLKGTKCEIKGGCPCSIGQSEIIRSANKVLEQLKEQGNAINRID